MLNREQCHTLEKMLRIVSTNFKNKRCLGTRETLAEVDDRQPDGKVMKKLKMGQYKWRTFDEVEVEAQYFGKGMRELGMDPREKVVIFAETRAEWMIAAHGLYKQACTVCTIYATLGEDGVAFGINETEVKYVITSHELLPKLKNILPQIPSVHTIIYFEDQLNPTDRTGFTDVRTVAYKEVIQAGRANKHGEIKFILKD
jgi:long-chain acyl-CoA synthetase